jgi:hypothetical protein
MSELIVRGTFDGLTYDEVELEIDRNRARCILMDCLPRWAIPPAIKFADTVAVYDWKANWPEVANIVREDKYGGFSRTEWLVRWGFSVYGLDLDRAVRGWGEMTDWNWWHYGMVNCCYITSPVLYSWAVALRPNKPTYIAYSVKHCFVVQGDQAGTIDTVFDFSVWFEKQLAKASGKPDLILSEWTRNGGKLLNRFLDLTLATGGQEPEGVGYDLWRLGLVSVPSWGLVEGSHSKAIGLEKPNIELAKPNIDCCGSPQPDIDLSKTKH